MNGKLIIGVLLFFVPFFTHAQTIDHLYDEGAFEKLIALADSLPDLLEEESVQLAYAQYRTGRFREAYKSFTALIEGGNYTSFSYFYRGKCAIALERDELGLLDLHAALELEPKDQFYWSEVGKYFYDKNELDTALYYYTLARKMNYEYGEPYLKVPVIFELQAKNERALNEYEKSISLIYKDPYYETLMRFYKTRLRYEMDKNADVALKGYGHILKEWPNHNASLEEILTIAHRHKNEALADSVFAVLKAHYQKEELQDHMMRDRGARVHRKTVRGLDLRILKMYEPENEKWNPTYKAITYKDASIKSVFIAKLLVDSIADSSAYVLSGRTVQGHITEPAFGNFGSEVSLDEFITSVKRILNQQMNVGMKPNMRLKGIRKKK